MHLDPATLHALAAGELPIANPVPLTDHLAGLEHRPLWRRRSRRVAVDPAAAARVTGGVLGGGSRIGSAAAFVLLGILLPCVLVAPTLLGARWRTRD